MKRALLSVLRARPGCMQSPGARGHRALRRARRRHAEDFVLLAFLSRARSAHHIADNLETSGDLSGAATSLAGLVAGPFPRGGGAELAPEVRGARRYTGPTGRFPQLARCIRSGISGRPSWPGERRRPQLLPRHLLETQGLQRNGAPNRWRRAIRRRCSSAATRHRAARGGHGGAVERDRTRDRKSAWQWQSGSFGGLAGAHQ